MAAQSFVGTSFEQPVNTFNITGLGVVMLIREIKKFNDKTKFYQAGSSEMYGVEKSPVKNESTSFQPVSPYAISKLAAFWAVNMYSKGYGMYAVNGILFNHESPIRGLEFVTRKITNGVAKISLGITKDLRLGNLAAKRDWGFAPEYVEGIWMMLQQKEPDYYVLATGETHSIKELVEEACHVAGIPPSRIKTSKNNFRPLDIPDLKGDYTKARKKLGWKPKTKFKKLVKIMVEEDISRWERWIKGEQFPWDVTTSVQESQVISKWKRI